MDLILWAMVPTFLYIVDILIFIPKYNRCKFDNTPMKEKLMWKGACILVPVLVLLARVVYMSVGMFSGRSGIDSTGMDSSGLSMMSSSALSASGVNVKSALCTYVFMCLGMIFCALGDIFLEIKFVKGGFLFGIGHLFYITALAILWYKVAGLHFTTLLIPMTIYIIISVSGCILAIKNLGELHRGLIVTYNFIISASFALGLTVLIYGELSAKVAGLGACLLVISDWMFARNKVVGKNHTNSLVSLLIYFSGQILISMFG